SRAGISRMGTWSVPGTDAISSSTCSRTSSNTTTEPSAWFGQRWTNSVGLSSGTGICVLECPLKNERFRTLRVAQRSQHRLEKVCARSSAVRLQRDETGRHDGLAADDDE